MPTPKKKQAPRTMEQNVEFSARQLIGNLQRAPKVKIPTPEQVAQQILQQAIRNVQARQGNKSFWTETEGIYYNRETGREYQPHHEAEKEFVYSDSPTNCAVFGSEGSGKSCAGIVKTIERVRRGMNGAMASPDLPHFKKSLWTEFKRWNPWQEVVEDQLYRADVSWEPREPFILTYKNGATLQCGGMDNPTAWEGQNLSFAYLDESRRMKDASALKVLKGRIRIPGHNGESPQFFTTTTKPPSTAHWLYEYFAPIQHNEEGVAEDQYLSFKEDSRVVNLHVRDNLQNLSEGFIGQRAQGLSPEEIALLIENEWIDVETQESFLPSIALWDSCKIELPPLDKDTPLVLSLDAAEVSDTFFATAGSWHPTRGREISCLRWTRCWQPKGKLLNFDEIEAELVEFIKSHRVVVLVYDAALIRQMCSRLSKIVWAREFSQQRDRLISDKSLLDAIMQRSVAHDGSHAILRQHLMNADKRVDIDGRKLRIVKRAAQLKIDGCISLSMLRDYLARPELNLGV